MNSSDKESIDGVMQVCSELQALLVEHPNKSDKAQKGLKELLKTLWNEVWNEELDEQLLSEEILSDDESPPQIANTLFSGGGTTETPSQHMRRRGFAGGRGSKGNPRIRGTPKREPNLPTNLFSNTYNYGEQDNVFNENSNPTRGIATNTKVRGKNRAPAKPLENDKAAPGLSTPVNTPSSVDTSNTIESASKSKGLRARIGRPTMHPTTPLTDSTQKEDDRMKQLKRGVSANTLLAKMLPHNVIKQLTSGVNVYAEHFDNVSILFADIVGFTEMASRVSPFELFSLLNEVYSIIDKLVDKHLLYKVETIGDCYMVIGGAHTTALEPHIAMARLALELITHFQGSKGIGIDQIPIKFRLGIHTGPVVGGIVGEKMPRYCFFGDVVNTASRMQSTSLDSKIQISSSTYEILNNRFVFEERGVNSFKGKGMMKTYFLRNEIVPLHCWPVFSPKSLDPGKNSYYSSKDGDQKKRNRNEGQAPVMISNPGKDDYFESKMIDF